MDKISVKDHYFQNSIDTVEIKASVELATIGEFQNIDEVEDELWVLQCPKGFDIAAHLENQQLKLPGRTKLDTKEAVAAKFVEDVKQTYGYCNRKGRYALKRLPVCGNILLRDRLLANTEVTPELAKTFCPKNERESMPEFIKVRHPLHGHQFDKQLRVDKKITERLKLADEISAQVLHEARLSRVTVKTKDKKKSHKAKGQEAKSTSIIHIDSDVEFVSEEIKPKHKKKKRKHSDSIAENDTQQRQEDQNPNKKKKNSKKSNAIEDVSEDLQWLQNL